MKARSDGEVFPNGQKYEGQWANGMRCLESLLIVARTRFTSGMARVPYGCPWGRRRSCGSCMWVVGRTTDGTVRGLSEPVMVSISGRGTCFFSDGQFFQGDWTQGKMHGEGLLRYGNGAEA